MSVVIKKNGKSEAWCDFCKDFHAYVNENWLTYSGYAINQPKFAIYCDKCWKHAFDNNFRPGCLIRNYGPVSPERLDRMELDVKTAKVAARRVTNKLDASTIDWESVDKAINERACRVNALAEQLNVNPQELRTALETHYGNRIVFKRGRSGGVFWATQS